MADNENTTPKQVHQDGAEGGDPVCIDGCTRKDDTMDGRNSVTCKWCSKSFHLTCVNIKATNRSVYSCEKCSGMPHSMNQACHDLHAIRQSYIKLVADLQNRLQDKDTEIRQLHEDNAELRVKVASLTAEMASKKWQEFRTSDRDLLIGDSVISPIDENKLVNTDVKSLSGGRIHTVKAELEKLHASEAKYNKVTLMVGTNDLQDAVSSDDDTVTIPQTAQEIADRYKDLLDEAKNIAQHVCVSSVCPRVDSVADSVEPLNVGLQVLCEDNGYQFLDNTPTFTLSDGSANDGYLEGGKGPHLTTAGINRLAKNLKLKKKNNVADISKASSTKKGKKPPKPPRGNPREGATTHPNDLRHRIPNRDSPHVHNNDHDHQWDGYESPVMYNRDGCYYCNEGGHSTRECRHKQPVQCHTCGGLGHKAKHH